MAVEPPKGPENHLFERIVRSLRRVVKQGENRANRPGTAKPGEQRADNLCIAERR